LIALSLPVLAALLLVLLSRAFYSRWRDMPIVRRATERRRANFLLRQLRATQAHMRVPSPEEFISSVNEKLLESGQRLEASLLNSLLRSAKLLFEAEGFSTEPPTPCAHANELDAARYRDMLSQRIQKFSAPNAVAHTRDTILHAYAGLCQSLPQFARQQDNEKRPLDTSAMKPAATVQLINVLADVPGTIEALIEPFYSQLAISSGIFAELRQQLDMNGHKMSGVPFTPKNFGSRTLIGPSEYNGTPEEIVHGYLRQTPLEQLFTANISFVIPEAVRFEHHWIVAGSGHGKSQALQYLIARDLERVKVDGATVVVIDSQGDLIRNIASLSVFAEGSPLHGKLCLIDPTDIEYPVALNLFDAGMERINRYNPLDRERLTNGVLELYDFVLGSLLSAELTQKQGVIFRYITRLMLQIPDATIHTFRELMEPQGYEKYRLHIEKLEGTARAFFETEFNSRQFEDTKRQVVRRLWGILENRTFERMFSHPKNKLDLFSEMNSGKVILINTAKDLLKQNGTEIFGRFFIALIAQVAQERATLPKEKRMPAFVYIDECADYLDQNVALILEQARKFNVGMILAHQYVGQIPPKLQESFATNTSIKFAGGTSDKDARTLSHMLRCTPEFIDQQTKGHFAASVRGLTTSAVSLEVPFGYVEAMPHMTEAEFNRERDRMRDRYAVHWRTASGASSIQTLAGAPSANPDTPSTASSTEW